MDDLFLRMNAVCPFSLQSVSIVWTLQSVPYNHRMHSSTYCSQCQHSQIHQNASICLTIWPQKLISLNTSFLLSKNILFYSKVMENRFIMSDVHYFTYSNHQCKILSTEDCYPHPHASGEVLFNSNSATSHIGLNKLVAQKHCKILRFYKICLDTMLLNLTIHQADVQMIYRAGTREEFCKW